MSYNLNYDNADTIEYTYLDGVKVSIKVVINNISYGIPLIVGNPDYDAIMEWAAIEGNSVVDPNAE